MTDEVDHRPPIIIDPLYIHHILGFANIYDSSTEGVNHRLLLLLVFKFRGTVGFNEFCKQSHVGPRNYALKGV